MLSSNLDAAEVYSIARLTVHIPRQQWPAFPQFGRRGARLRHPIIVRSHRGAVPGGDFCLVHSATEMQEAISALLSDREAAEAQAKRGLETIRARHSCRHRAEQLTSFWEELFQ
jgi:hypothetical protein